MGKASSFLLLLSLFYIAHNAKSATTTTDFIKSSCSSARYPNLCVSSLSSYASKIQQSPHKMAQAALAVSHSNSQSLKVFVSNLNKSKGLKKIEYGALKDCLEVIDDCKDQISQSIQELKLIGEKKGKDFSFHLSNVQTWVSSAITDLNTCLDGFEEKAMEGKVKTSITPKVTNVLQLTSNALALCNKLA
ncbi:hypothetical protein UlMin_024947 [Ulmus minor]